VGHETGEAHGEDNPRQKEDMAQRNDHWHPPLRITEKYKLQIAEFDGFVKSRLTGGNRCPVFLSAYAEGHGLCPWMNADSVAR
jgi:hypothetical protein